MSRTVIKMAALAAGCVLAGSTPAIAGTLYLYADSYYHGQIGAFSSKMSQVRNVSAVNNDSLSSFHNGTQYSVAFYHDANAKGTCFTGDPYSSAAWFAWWDDNTVSSFWLGKKC